MARRKHVPRRTCVICRRTLPKHELIRLVRTSKSGVQIDPGGKLPGRGAYLCSDPACWEDAAHSNALDSALRTTLTEDERAAIAAYGAQHAPQQTNHD